MARKPSTICIRCARLSIPLLPARLHFCQPPGVRDAIIILSEFDQSLTSGEQKKERAPAALHMLRGAVAKWSKNWHLVLKHGANRLHCNFVN